MTMATTTDLLNYASQLVSEVENATHFAQYASAKEEGARLGRRIDSYLETGAFEGQARNELRAAKHLATSGIYQARLNQFQARGWRMH